jgi:hypothetical protein
MKHCIDCHNEKDDAEFPHLVAHEVTNQRWQGSNVHTEMTTPYRLWMCRPCWNHLVTIGPN